MGNIRYLDSFANASYHALQVQAQKRYSNGFTAGLAYTFGKALGEGYGRNDPAGNVNPTYQDPVQGEWLRGDAELHRLRTVVGEEIERALMSLSEDARTVVLLDLEGLTEQEVADVMDCPAGTIKSRLWRARAALRHQLADYSGNQVVK